MLVFADSPWHVLTALVIFLAGLWIALILRRVFTISHEQALLFYLWHSAFCVLYFSYSLNNVADSTLYYLDSLTYDLGPGLGTRGIYFLTSLLSGGLGLSYGGAFLVYNVFGFIGMLAFASALQQILATASTFPRQVALLFILLPGLSFWSSAIGKDALSFMAAGLAVWATLGLGHRYPAMLVSCLAMLLVRPHMAGILLVSLAVALLFFSRISAGRKIALATVTIPAAIVAVGFGAQFAGLGEAAKIEDVGDYFQTRQAHNLGGGSSVDIASLSIPWRMMSYLFRPLFFDASGALGLVVSVENLFLIAIFGYAACMRFLGRRSTLDSCALSFFLIYSAASWFVLANTTANLGIAIRQKWMFLPMMFAIAFSLMPQQRPCLSSFLPSRCAGSAGRRPRAIATKDSF